MKLRSEIKGSHVNGSLDATIPLILINCTMIILQSRMVQITCTSVFRDQITKV